VFRRINILCLLISVMLFSSMPVFAKHYSKYNYGVYKARRLKQALRKEKKSAAPKKFITKDRLSRFKAKYGKACKAKWSNSGYIKKIYNIQNAPLVPGGGEDGVRKFLNNNSKLFGMANMLTSLKFLRKYKALGASRFVYGLNHNGIPIFGKRLYVNLCNANRVRMLNNEIPADITFLDYEEHLTMDDAVKIAEKLFDAEKIDWQSGGDVYFPEYSNVYSKVWMLSFITSKPAGMWKVAVDKESGAVRWARNFAKRAVDGSGLVFDPNPVVFHKDTSIKDNDDADSELLSSALVDVTLKLLDDPINGRYVLSGPYVNIEGKMADESSPNDFRYSRSNDRFNEVMAYYHIHTFHDYISSLGFDILNGSPIDVNANNGSEDNSYYYPGTNSIAFGNGGVDDAEDADIIIHEYGHAIIDNKVNLFGMNTESDTIGEAFGDYLACSYSADKGFNVTHFAEWDAAPFGSYLRKVETTKVYPNDVDGQEHNDAPLLSSVLWELRTQTDKTTMDRLVIRAATNYITASATLQDFATGMFAADQEFYGGIHSSMIINAFKARGIYGTLISEEFEGISALPSTEWLVNQTSSSSWSLSGFGDRNASVTGNPQEVQDEWLLSPPFKFEEQPKVSFFWMRNDDSISPEQGAVMSVSVSSDGGGTFGTPVFTVTESSTPAEKWNHETISLRNYANMNNVVIGFRYTGKGGDSISIDNIAVVNSFVPPTASVITPSGKKQGQVSLSLILSDLESDPASVVVEYSTDNGTTFKPATLSTGGSQTTGLSTSALGISHTVIWDSVSDIGQTSELAILRVTPQYGSIKGTAVITPIFVVDNSIPTPSTGNIGLALLMLVFPLLLVIREKV